MIRWQEILCQPAWYQPSEFPAVGEKEVHVWRWNYHAHAQYIDHFLKTLDCNERGRSSRFFKAGDRDRYIVNHGLLRWLLSGYTGCRPKEITFVRNDFGKPLLEKRGAERSIEFNLTDSGLMGMAAIGCGQPVGIDIERIRPIADKHLLVQEVFSGDELKLLDGVEDEYIEEVFFLCWTRKEAVIKAIGTGLSTSLKEFSTLPNYRPVDLTKNNIMESHDFDWKITSHWAINGYLSALATTKDMIGIDYFDLTTIDLFGA